MKNYSITHLNNLSRSELHYLLSLINAEISINILLASSNVLFIHSHKENEEIYEIIDEKAKVIIHQLLIFIFK